MRPIRSPQVSQSQTAYVFSSETIKAQSCRKTGGVLISPTLERYGFPFVSLSLTKKLNVREENETTQFAELEFY